MKKALLWILLLGIPVFSFAQRWKKTRYDLIMGLGTTNFLGELGGANKIGTHFAGDLDFNKTRQSLMVGMRYRLSNRFAGRANFSYGRLRGDDKETKEPFRRFRNLNFASNVYELNVNLEVATTTEQVGKRYRLRGVRGKRGYEIYSYFFGGIGALYFNPKAKAGGWVKLQPLGTEGQGVLATRKKYKRVQVCIPVGFGLKYGLKKNWSVGLEFGIRYTFTDYLDDVSTTYVSNAVLMQQDKGELAVAMADRSGEAVSEEDLSYTTGPGLQRGNPRYNDAYVFSMITVTYKMKMTRNGVPRF